MTATDEKRSAPSAAVQALHLADLHWSLLRSDDGQLMRRDLGSQIVHPLAGQATRQALQRLVWQASGKVCSAGAAADAQAVLLAMAEQGAEPAPMMHRFGAHGSARVIDLALAADDARAVVLDQGRASIGTPDLPYRRRYGRMTGALPLPDLSSTSAADAQALRRHVPVSDADWPALLGWLVAVLLGDLAVPVLTFGGESGVGKTTSARRLAQLLDPSAALITRAPTDDDAWQALLPHRRVVGIDNLSSIPQWLSDCLCTAVTGESYLARRLYTDVDSDPLVLSYRRAVILTSIDAAASRGDLAERLLPVQLAHISADRRQTDQALQQAWDQDYARIFSGLCHLAAQVLQVLPAMRDVRPLPRMADYGSVLAALDHLQVTQGALSDYLARQAGDVAETLSAAGQAILTLVQQVAARGPWVGTATDLQRAISAGLPPDRQQPRGWPTNSQQLGAVLKQQGQALRASGLTIEHVRRTATTPAQVRLTCMAADDLAGL